MEGGTIRGKPREDEPTPRHRDLRTSLLLGLVCLLVYNANLRSISSGDTYPARYLPFGIWGYGSLLLDSISNVTAQGRPISTRTARRPSDAYWIVQGRGDHAISLYPVVLPVLVAPLYVPAIGYLQARGWTEPRLERTARVMEKLTASLLAASSAALLYLLLRRRAEPRDALLLTVAFAFGTTTWVISSQALWQHGLAELLVVGALLLLTGPYTPTRALAAGALCGLIAANRPPDVILAAALGLYGLWWARRPDRSVATPPAAAPSAPPTGNESRDWRQSAAAPIVASRGTPRSSEPRPPVAGHGTPGWPETGRPPAWRSVGVPLLVAGAAVPLGLVLAYNLGVAGSVAGGYGLSGKATFFQHPLLSGIAGLMVSPTRGLFVFSPFLLFLPLRLRDVLGVSGARARGLTLALGIAVALQVLLYAKTDWRIGFCWGPRWMTDLLPLLLWMLPPVVAALGAAGRLVFTLACCAAIAIQAVGAFWYTGKSDKAIFAVAAGPGQMKAAWDLRNTPFIAELRHARAPGDLALDVRGYLDSVSAGGREVDAITPGQELLVAGWALAGDRAPWRVVVLMDGEPAGATWSFLGRPDIASTLHEASPSGWRIVIGTGALAPGQHLLTAAAQTSDYGEVHVLGRRRILARAAAPRGPGRTMSGGTPQGRPLGEASESSAGARPTLAQREGLGSPAADGPPPGPGRSDDLAGAARRAAAALAERQQPAGYWLTSYTGAPRFDNPRREMNTFLTAMIVDLLAPVATAGGLGDSLERARRHLAAQIEASGLVRYHGRPDAPTIPALGCAITPDADDTALVWRIAAGGERARLPAALAVLERYRTRDGLYRTWLAPRDRYQCIDPGRDPNPADAGIQMHVLLLLAQVDPPAARALCGALGRAVAEDRVWVYYQAAPLVPMLRQADLRQAGCPLRLPASRLRTRVPGQEVWVAAGEQLQRLLDPDLPAPAAATTLTLLQALADGDFSPVRRSPPLLYHNDLTASTPRFYWSEDFGYALWLRLYLENAHRHRH